jgi:uncharacterized protein with HEPN domain
MPKRDNSLLVQDIYEAGDKIIRFTSGYSFNEYLNDERTTDAVIRNFEVIGEVSHLLLKGLRNNTRMWNGVK